MEARKFTKTEYEEKEGKRFKINTMEVREVDLLLNDWEWLHENMMEDNWEYGQSNGFFQNDDDFCYLDCESVAQRMDEWKDELKDNEETFNDYQESFQKTYNKIYDLLSANFGFDVFYSSKIETVNGDDKSLSSN
jgi:hypothetical protein